jgi:hypothetical protein
MSESKDFIKSFENISISTPFYIDNNLDIKENYFITSVNLNFYQIWSIFNEIPIIYKNGKCKYEWRFQQNQGEPIFCIYDWNNPNSLLQTKKWYIGSNTNNEEKNSEFLKNLCDAIECYNLYYKSIENHIFTSKDPVVHKRLQQIKYSIVKHKELLKSL